jgi:hypothetical protein
MIANCLFTKLIWQRVKSWSGLDSTACPRVAFLAGDTGGGQTLGAARPFFLLSRLLGWQQRGSLSLSLSCSAACAAVGRLAPLRERRGVRWGCLSRLRRRRPVPMPALGGSGEALLPPPLPSSSSMAAAAHPGPLLEPGQADLVPRRQDLAPPVGGGAHGGNHGGGG